MQTAERDVSVILRGTGGQHAASRRCMMTRILEPQLVGNDELARLLDTAAASTRKRAHLLLHADHQDQVQRLLIGLEPPSYVRPHVHSEQWEMIVLLRGRFDFLIFDPQAELVQRLAMSAAAPVAQIPPGTWHGGVRSSRPAALRGAGFSSEPRGRVDVRVGVGRRRRSVATKGLRGHDSGEWVRSDRRQKQRRRSRRSSYPCRQACQAPEQAPPGPWPRQVPVP